MTRAKVKKIFVLPDVHVPYQDDRALNLTLQAMAIYNPDVIVCVGDLLDMYAVSSFDKDPSRTETLQDEIDEAIELLSKIDNMFPKAKKIILEGNHEHRLQRYINKNAASLSSLRELKLDKLLKLKETKWKWIPSSQFYEIGPITFTHGEFCTVNSAKKHLDKYQAQCLIYGHTHRLRYWSQRQIDGSTKESYEAGCLAGLDADYVKLADWQHGWITAEVQGKEYWVHQHRINEQYHISFQGQVLRG